MPGQSPTSSIANCRCKFFFLQHSRQIEPFLFQRSPWKTSLQSLSKPHGRDDFWASTTVHSKQVSEVEVDAMGRAQHHLSYEHLTWKHRVNWRFLRPHARDDFQASPKNAFSRQASKVEVDAMGRAQELQKNTQMNLPARPQGGWRDTGTPWGHDHQETRRNTAEHWSRGTCVLISLQQRRDHFSSPPTQLRLARSHARTKRNDFPTGELRSPSISLPKLRSRMKGFCRESCMCVRMLCVDGQLPSIRIDSFWWEIIFSTATRLFSSH